MKKRFITNNDDTVTDKKTGLMWAQDGLGVGCAKGKTLNWQESIKFCNKLDFAGYKDWRLPTLEELFSIVDYGKSNPVIDRIFLNTKDDWYWTSTTYVPITTHAWGVDFDDGGVDSGDKTNNNYVRAVRSV